MSGYVSVDVRTQIATDLPEDTAVPGYCGNDYYTGGVFAVFFFQRIVWNHFGC
ncbi:hypothetical protein D3C76_1516130 [compost metagenome]